MLYLEDLARLKCSTPGCDCAGVMWVHSKCHPGAPKEVSMHPDGVVEVYCAICKSYIVSFAIASRERG